MITDARCRPHRKQGLLLLTALLTLVPAGAGAQTLGTGADAGKADELHRRADALTQTQNQGDWKKAARLFEDAARSRGDGDAAAIQEHLFAGALRYYTGSPARAQTNLEEAAGIALRNGRVLESARLFLQAAFVAQERGHPGEAARLAGNAKHLAGSPHLSRTECDAILAQVSERASRVARGG